MDRPERAGGFCPRNFAVGTPSFISASTDGVLAAAGAKPVGPRRTTTASWRSFDATIYKDRNLIERFFNKLKHFRKVATRYEKSAQNYMAVVLIASSRLWMRHYESAS